MQTTMDDIRQKLQPDEEILACIRCSTNFFIYRLVVVPGLLAATNHKLIFVSNSVAGDSLCEEYLYKDIEDFKRKKWLMSDYLRMRHKQDIVKFVRMTTGSVDVLMNTVQKRIH